MDLATLMFIAHRAATGEVVRAMREAGYPITVAQARIAQRISPGGSRLTELAEQAQVTKQTASMLVAALEQEGLVERVTDPDDGRARLIVFTRRGRAAVEHAGTVVTSIEATWTDHLGPELARALREALERLQEITDPYR